MSQYARLLRLGHVAPLLFATLFARLPIGINSLAIVLFLREETGSFAVAGAVAGSVALGTAVGAPLVGRVVDRLGPRVLVPLAAVHAAGLGGLVVLGSTGAPDALLVLDGVVTGLALPPASSVLRSLWPRLVREEPELLSTAFALDSVATETLFVLGPLLTGALAATVGAEAALVLSAASVLVGTVAFVAQEPVRRRAPAPAGERHLLGALQSAGIRTLVLSTFPVGFAFGTLEVAIPAFADAEGHPGWAGLLIAVWSVGSAAGGLVYGARPWSLSLHDMHVRLAWVIPFSFLPLLLAPSVAVMALLVIPAGSLIAPFIATRNELAGTVAPAGAETEAYTWPLTALVGGIAAGAAVSGALADGPGWRAAVVAAIVAAAVGAVVTLARRGAFPSGRDAAVRSDAAA